MRVSLSSLSDIVHGATSVNRKKNDCRGSCFSHTLQSLEVGYGPITAPSVSVTGAGSLICACFRYCHWEKRKKKKKEEGEAEGDRQGPFSPERSHRTGVRQDAPQRRAHKTRDYLAKTSKPGPAGAKRC